MSSYRLAVPKRRWPKVLMITSICLLVLSIGSVLVIRRTYEENLRPYSNSEQAVQIVVPSGATAEEISKILEDAEVIRAAWAFEWYIRTNDLRSNLLAGTYMIRPNMSIPEIADILTEGKIATDLVTILPGKRLDQIRQDLINKHGFDEAQVDRALDPGLYTDHPALVDKPRGASLEGYLYPESFHKSAETKPETIIRASLDQMHKHLTPDIRAGIVRQGLTVHEGVVLAAVIEKEVNNPEDAAKVAQVFLKRLRENIALQSDPTAIYGAVMDGVSLPTERAAAAAIAHNSIYNTYKHPGLPPGPISNVSKTSLEAVAKPANTNYLFFVAGSDCVTRFSETLAQHEALQAEFGICPS